MKKMMLLLLNLAAVIYAWDIIGDPEHTANIRSYLTFKLGDESQWSKYPELIKDFSQDALKPYGYMSANIQLDIKKKTIYVHPGIDTTFNTINITLSNDCSNITPHPTTLENLTFRNDLYIALKDDLLTQANNIGYYDANVTGSVRVDKQRANVDIHLSCHRQYTLRDITVSSPFDQDLYVRHGEQHLNKPIGSIDFLSFKKSIRSRSELGQHEITTIKNKDNHSVIWNVVNRKTPEDQRSVGAGFISGKGMDIMLKYASIRKPYAHYSSILSHISTQSIDGQWVYAVPSRIFLDGTHSVRVFHEIFPNHRFNQLSRSELSYRLTRVNEGLRTEYGVSLQYNRDQPDDTPIGSHAIYPYIQQKIDWDDIHHHTQLIWLAKCSTQFFGSEFDFLSINVNLHHRHEISPYLLAKINLQAAGIVHNKDVQDSWLYRTGGPISVTGYPVDSIGPGNFLNVGRAGLFYPVTNSWYLGYWITAGSASSAPLNDIHVGHAVAADMQTPLGAIELSIGKAPGHNLQFAITLLPL